MAEPTQEELEFVKWYRWNFAEERELPCLGCPDIKIIKCSRMETHPTKVLGCQKFKKYQQRVDHGFDWETYGKR